MGSCCPQGRRCQGQGEAEDFTHRCSAAPFLPAPKTTPGPSKNFSCFHHKNHSKSLPQEQIFKTLEETEMPKVFALHQQGEAPGCTHPAPERLTQLLMMAKRKLSKKYRNNECINSCSAPARASWEMPGRESKHPNKLRGSNTETCNSGEGNFLKLS